MGIIIINALAVLCLLFSIIKDRKKTVQALMVAWQNAKQITPLIVIVVLIVGLANGFLPSNWLPQMLGGSSGILGILISAIIGSFMAIPPVVIFPLTASLLHTVSQSGNGVGMVGLAAVAVLVTTNSMVGMATLPIEIKIMGSRSATIRILVGLIAAVSVALLMGVILSGSKF